MRRANPPPELIGLCGSEHRPLVEMLSLYCGDRDVAEELAQETFIRLCQHWRRVARMKNPRAWIRRVAINLAHSHYRRAKTEARARTALGIKPREIDETDAAEGLSVRRAIASLPHRQKTVVVLRYYEDFTFAQIAELLQIPENTAKSLARRAVLALRDDPRLKALKEVQDAI